MSTSTELRGGELVPLSERLRYMLWFRLATVATVLGIAGFAREIIGVDLEVIAVGTGIYAAVSLAGSALWRWLQGRSLFLFGALLILDGAYLATVAHVTGGASGPLQYLILIHIVTVALLASYRTSLKIALWHSILLLVIYYAQVSNLIAPPGEGVLVLPGSELQRLTVFMASFWLVALATASFSAVNERELRRRRYDLEALARLAGELEEARNSVTVGEVLLRHLSDAFDFERMLLVELPDAGSGGLLAWRGVEERPLGGLSVASGSLLAAAAANKSTLLVSVVDPETDPMLVEAIPAARNLFVTPLTAEGRAIGLLVVEHGMRAGSRIERRVVAMVERFTSHAALALRNAWLLEEVQERASTDGLTGIANRRTLQSTLERELARSQRDGSVVSLIMLDLDHFKQLNDEHGHPAGDAVLREVSGLLAEHCREFDTPARYGGEEFAVVLPGCDTATAYGIAERLRVAIRDTHTTVSVTTSCGVATAPAHGRDANALIQAADDALYTSKRAGRDRVTTAAGSVPDRSAAVTPLGRRPHTPGAAATSDDNDTHLAG